MKSNQDTIIHTTGLSRRFGSIQAVNHLELDVPAGSVYAFLGPNGAGKTTTIRMVLGLIRPDAGQVHLFGQPIGRGQRDLLASVGALVESPCLYRHLTGYENLEITRCLLGLPPKNIREVLSIVHLEKDAHRLVRGYSTGMCQRLGLAMALLNQPALLVLDEPTNGLDPAGIHEVRDLITRLPREYGITVFLSSHLLSEVEQVATHLGIINSGRLLFQGSPAELNERRQEYLSIEVDRPDRARECLRENGWRVEPHGSRHLRAQVRHPEEIAHINQILVANGLQVFHLSLEQLSLEDIFLKLTNGQPAPAVVHTGAALMAAGR